MGKLYKDEQSYYRESKFHTLIAIKFGSHGDVVNQIRYIVQGEESDDQLDP